MGSGNRPARNVIRRLAKPISRRMRQERRQANWERRWENPAYLPPFEIAGPDAAVEHAVDDGWFEPGMSALDIGCGLGHNAAYLASQGLDAKGIDFSSSAIARAAAEHASIPNLRFVAVDVVQRNGFDRDFDVLVDRGCLHGIDPIFRDGYVRNIMRWARPGARFLLIMRTKGEPETEVMEEARNLFEPRFNFVGSAQTDVAGPASLEPLKAVAIRFVRTS